MKTVPAFIGRYKVEGWLGAGTYGDVYKGHDLGIERYVAIKLLKEDSDESRDWFAREARAAGRLSHPYIVTIYEYGEHVGRPFIAMEFVDGESLAQVIRRKAALPIERKLQIIGALCSGLDHAHKAGVIHRDVKPANVMMDEKNIIKIVDFGVARLTSSVTVGVVAGTWNYMSPEQISGRPVDHRSDVFAVGAVFYELLASQKAFAGGPNDGISDRIKYDPPAPLRDLCPDVDPEIERIVARALQKDRENRYQDLGAMQEDIARARRRLEGTTIPRLQKTRPEIKALEEARRAQIAKHLTAAQAAFDRAEYDQAIADWTEAAMIDPNDPRPFELIDKARLAIDELQVKQWLAEARERLGRAELTAASELIERALSLNPALVDASTLRRQVQETRQQLERARAIRRATDEARERFDQGEFAAAIESALKALALDPSFAEALDLHQRAADALEQKRLREEHERRVQELLAAARKQFIAGDRLGALQRLREFTPTHAEVSALLSDLTIEHEELERLKREEEQRREREHRAAIEKALADAKASLASGALDAAVRSADLVLTLDSTSSQGRELRQQALAAIEARRRREADQRRAHEVVATAQQKFLAGDHESALQMLREVQPLDPDVSAVLTRLTTEYEAVKRRRAEEAQRAAERDRAFEAALQSAEQSLLAGAFEPALRSVDEALALVPSSREAQQMRARVITARENHRQAEQKARERQQRVVTLLTAARSDLQAGRLDDAAQKLSSVRQIDRDAAGLQELVESVERERAAASTRPAQPPVEKTVRVDRPSSADDLRLPTDTTPDTTPETAPDVARPAVPVASSWRLAAALIAGAAGIVIILIVTSGPQPTPTPTPSTSAGSIATPPPPPAAAPVPETPVPDNPPSGTPTPPPGAAPPDTAVEEKLVPIRRAAQQQLARGERQQALKSITEGLKLAPGDEALRALLIRMTTEARGAAERARVQAIQSQARELATATFEQGVVKLREGDQEVKAGERTPRGPRFLDGHRHLRPGGC